MSGPNQGTATGEQSLDQMLAPGEEVLWHEGRGRRQIALQLVLILCSASFTAGGISLAKWFVLPDRPLWLWIGLGGCVLGAVCLLLRRDSGAMPRRPEAIVTETRALYRNNVTALDVGEIQLSDIAAAEELSSDEGSVRIERRNGSAVVWTDLEDSRYFAGLLRVTSGLTSPWPAYRLDMFDLIVVQITYLAVFILPSVLVFAQTLVTGTKPQGLEWFHAYFYAIPAAAVICFATLHAARLSVFLIGWRSRCPATVHAWLWPRSYDTDFERQIHERWLLNPLYRRLACALYGQTLRREDAGEGGSHGD